jgi:hypothetical protein
MTQVRTISKYPTKFFWCCNLAVKVWTISKFCRAIFTVLPSSSKMSTISKFLYRNYLLCCHLPVKMWTIPKIFAVLPSSGKHLNYSKIFGEKKCELFQNFPNKIFYRAAICREKFELFQNFRDKFLTVLPPKGKMWTISYLSMFYRSQYYSFQQQNSELPKHLFSHDIAI